MHNKKLPKGITYQYGRAKPFLVRFQDRASGVKFLDSFANLADAEKALESVKMRAAHCKETAAAAERLPAEIPKSETLLSVLAAEWWSHFRESLATSTRESYRLILEDHILPYFGECRLREVTREMVIAFIARQRALITQFHSRPSEKSILNRLGVLSAFMDEMLAQGLVVENVVQLARKAEFSRHKQRLMKTQQTDKLREKVLTNEEAERLLLAAKDWFATGKNKLGHGWHQGEAYFPLLLVMNTGLRIGELSALQWGDLRYTDALGQRLPQGPYLHIAKTMVLSAHRGSRSVSVLQRHTKGKTSRSVPVHSELAGALEEWRSLATSWGYSVDDSAPMFPIAHEFAGFKSLVRRIAEKAGLPSNCWGIHTLRHTAATALLLSGKNVHDLQRLLGHAHIQTTEKYLHAQGHTPYGVTDALAWTCSVGVDTQKTDNVRRLDLRPAQKNRSGIEHLGVPTERQDFSENMPSVQSNTRPVQRFKPSSVALNEES